MALHEVQLKGYSVRPGNLSLGTVDSYGIEQLHVTLDDTWSGLAVTATFNPPEGEPVEIRVPENGLIDVPAEATANDGTGTIVYCGVANGVQRISKTQGYNVITHGNVGTTVAFNPSESLATQVLQAALSAEKNSAEANTAAQSAQTAAENAAVAAQASAESASKAAEEAAAAKPYAESAKASAEAARNSENQAQQSSAEANTAKNAAQNAQAGAESSATAAAKSAKEAAASAVNLDSAANTATQKAAAASASAAAAKTSESAAASSEAATRKHANSAESAAKTAGEAAASAAKAKTSAESAQADAAASKTVAANSAIAAKTSEDAAAKSAADAKTSEDAAAKSAADADSTANSINDSMTQIAANKEAVSQLKEDTTALQKRQNVLVGSETGNPVSCDDAYSAPLCGLTVYGRSTQDGTPTPEAPVPIVSAGDGGSVAVNVTGANMLEGTKPGVKSTVAGITYTIYENGVLITGTAIKTFNIILHNDTNHRLTRGIYYLTTRGLSPSAMLNFYFIGKFSSDMQNQKVTLTRDTEFSLSLQILGGATLNTTVQVSLTRNKITTYSPYYEQLLTLPTPNGLPGVPVTSGGNYTDQSGQKWICDEVDLGRGVKVQRVIKVEVDGETVKFVQTGNYVNITLRDLPIALYNTGQKIFATSTFTKLPWFYNMVNGQFLYLIAPDMSDKINVSCKKQLGKIYYALATPIETPLTPAEIAAYKALTAYAPDTVVQASDGAGIKLDYQRDVNLVIKNFEDAIASMTTT